MCRLILFTIFLLLFAIADVGSLGGFRQAACEEEVEDFVEPPKNILLITSVTAAGRMNPRRCRVRCAPAAPSISRRTGLTPFAVRAFLSMTFKQLHRDNGIGRSLQI